MSYKSMELLVRRLIFKYAEGPATLKSNELSDIKPRPLNVEVISQDYEDLPPSTERPIVQNTFESEEEEPQTLRPRNESNLTPKQQKLVYILDKLRINDLMTQTYRDVMFDRVAAQGEAGLKEIAKELQNYVNELVENQYYFQVTIEGVKKYIDNFLLDK